MVQQDHRGSETRCVSPFITSFVSIVVDQSLDRFDPRLVFNMDETMLQVSANSRTKVVVPREMSNPRAKSDSGVAWHITMILCVCADGSAVKPTIILPLKHFPQELDEMADSYHWAGHDSGWITEELFSQWVEKILIPHVSNVRNQHNLWHEPALLFLDGHGSRGSPDALDLLTYNNIVAVTIPSHSSHILQPMDCGINARYKSELRKAKRHYPGKSSSEKRVAIVKASDEALHNTFYHQVIKNAWKKSGLWPWNPAQVLEDPESVCKPEVETNKKRKSRGILLSGSVVTSDEVREEIRQRKYQRK